MVCSTMTKNKNIQKLTLIDKNGIETSDLVFDKICVDKPIEKDIQEAWERRKFILSYRNCRIPSSNHMQ